jgi:hypothetical protein
MPAALSLQHAEEWLIDFALSGNNSTSVGSNSALLLHLLLCYFDIIKSSLSAKAEAF